MPVLYVQEVAYDSIRRERASEVAARPLQRATCSKLGTLSVAN
jgi:hypothetical protein